MEIRQPPPSQPPAYDAEKMAEMSRLTEVMNTARRVKNGFMWSVWQGFAALNKLKALQAANPLAVPPAEMMR